MHAQKFMVVSTIKEHITMATKTKPYASTAHVQTEAKSAVSNLQSCIHVAGKRVTEDEVENMIESDNPAIFTQDVCVQSSVGVLI